MIYRANTMIYHKLGVTYHRFRITYHVPLHEIFLLVITPQTYFDYCGKAITRENYLHAWGVSKPTNLYDCLRRGNEGSDVRIKNVIILVLNYAHKFIISAGYVRADGQAI